MPQYSAAPGRLPTSRSLSGGVDYRKSPYLSAWNARQGQPFLTLYDMLRLNNKDAVDQLATDRTPTYTSATVGYSLPLTDKLQLNLDATASNMSGTVASGGVDAFPSMETNSTTPAQLMGTGLFADGDMYIVGFRFADREASNLYVLDLNARYPLTSEFRINPRLRLGYQVGDGTDLRELTVLPSALFNYYWTRT